MARRRKRSPDAKLLWLQARLSGTAYASFVHAIARVGHSFALTLPVMSTPASVAFLDGIEKHIRTRVTTGRAGKYSRQVVLVTIETAAPVARKIADVGDLFAFEGFEFPEDLVVLDTTGEPLFACCSHDREAWIKATSAQIGVLRAAMPDFDRWFGTTDPPRRIR